MVTPTPAIVFEVVAQAVRQEKGKKHTQTGREEIIPYILRRDVVHVENPKNPQAMRFIKVYCIHFKHQNLSSNDTLLHMKYRDLTTVFSQFYPLAFVVGMHML